MRSDPRLDGFGRSAAGFAWRLCLGLSLAALLAGCGPSRRVRLAPEEIPFPALVATKQQLLDGLEASSEGIDTLQAEVNLVATGGGLSSDVVAQYPETAGPLLARRPSHIHMQGRNVLGFVTAFDMVSDGKTFRVSIPTRNRFIMGPTNARVQDENPIMNLRPQHIMEALFVDVSGYLADPGVLDVLEEVREGRLSFYVFSFIDASESRLLEKIWIDRRDLTVARKQVFGASGGVEMDATYSRYERYGDVSYPMEIHVQKPVIDYELTIRLQDVQLNLLTDDSQFELAIPSGYEVIVLDDDTASSPSNARAESP